MTAALAWSDAVTAAQLFAVDPIGTGGVLVRSRAGPVRERWMAMLRAALPPSGPLKHLPLHIADGRLLGGLDLNATLLAGRPVAERGLLAEADGGVLILAMAERLSSATTVHITAAMDARETIVERDGLSLRMPARFGVIALDEGLDDEFAPGSLGDRLGFHIDLNEVPIREADEFAMDRAAISAARERLSALRTNAEQVEAMCTAAAALGIVSLRAPILALRVACASAALAAHHAVEQDDIALAARLVLAPRALVFPQEQGPEQRSRRRSSHRRNPPATTTPTRTIPISIAPSMRSSLPRSRPRFRPMCLRRCAGLRCDRAAGLRARPARCRNPTNAAVRPVCCVASCAPAPSSM